MNKLHDLLRLICTKPMSNREIGASLSVSKTTVQRYRALVKTLGQTWDDLKHLALPELDRTFNNRHYRQKPTVVLEFEEIDKSLEHPGMTLWYWWKEWRAQMPEQTLSYSRLAARYREHRRALPKSMRQVHTPGQKAFVDYSGKRPWYVDRTTGEKVFVELFVGVLGASNYVYATCTASQTIPDWIEAHVRMFEALGGVTAMVVPDNLRSAITKTGAMPIVQRNYLEMAEHYGTAILPARPYRPRDKSKAEGSVLLAQRAFLPLLRHRTFFSLDEINLALAEVVAQINSRAFKKRPGTRQQLFDNVEKRALLPLPSSRFVYSQWTAKQTVPPDYHVPVFGHYYSVPHDYVAKAVEARVSASTVEIICERACIARHDLSTEKGGHTTVVEHMPAAHRGQAERTPERMLLWAQSVGPRTEEVMHLQMRRKVPLQGLPGCDVIRGFARHFGSAQLEKACDQALTLRNATPSMLKRLLAERETGKHATTKKCGTSITRPLSTIRSRRKQSSTQQTTKTKRSARALSQRLRPMPRKVADVARAGESEKGEKS